MGDLTAFARVELRTTGAEAKVASASAQPELVRVPLRVVAVDGVRGRT